MKRIVAGLALLAACGPRTAPLATPETSLRETLVFANGQDGYKCYRIPAIVAAPDGTLLAFAEGRRNDCGDFGDVDIVLKTSTDQGRTWGPLRVVVDFGTNQAGNPAPVFDLLDPRFPKGRLIMAYNTGTEGEREVREGRAIREVWTVSSTDNGQSWTAPQNITTQVNRPNKPALNPAYTFGEDWRSYANTPGHALQLAEGPHRGRLFVAANHSAGPPQPHFRDYQAHGFYSDDHGQSWQLTPTLPYPGGNESTAAETTGGGLLFNARNQSGDAKARLLAHSADGGQSWGPVRVATDLPDPVCQGSMVSFFPEKAKKRVLLFSNLNDTTKRRNLTVRTSVDDGRTWSAGRVVYAGSAAYSDLVMQRNGGIGLLYEKDDYTKITYAAFPYSWLKP